MPSKINKNLAARTPAEELWLARKAAGLTSEQAALAAGIGRSAYRAAELGRIPLPAPFKTGLVKVRAPSTPLLLALARRRSGLGLAGLAKAGSVSRVTVLAWERAGRGELVRFWEKHGYRFK